MPTIPTIELTRLQDARNNYRAALTALQKAAGKGAQRLGGRGFPDVEEPIKAAMLAVNSTRRAYQNAVREEGVPPPVTTKLYVVSVRTDRPAEHDGNVEIDQWSYFSLGMASGRVDAIISDLMKGGWRSVGQTRCHRQNSGYGTDTFRNPNTGEVVTVYLYQNICGDCRQPPKPYGIARSDELVCQDGCAANK